MRAGRLDYRLRIDQVTETKDASGSPSEAWAEFATVWAERRPLAGRERFLAQQVDANLDHEFIVRHLSGVTAKMRGVGVNDSKTYDFHAVIPVGRNDSIRILATEKVA